MEMDGGGGGGNGDSEDEGAEEDDQDTQWRLHRYQREQWLKEQVGNRLHHVMNKAIIPNQWSAYYNP